MRQGTEGEKDKFVWGDGERGTNSREGRRGARENEFTRGEEAGSERGNELREGREERNNFFKGIGQICVGKNGREEQI